MIIMLLYVNMLEHMSGVCSAAPVAGQTQRIHSSDLIIPVGHTCCILLWVCEHSLKASAVFTK